VGMVILLSESTRSHTGRSVALREIIAKAWN
jgi:hypothetical protein